MQERVPKRWALSYHCLTKPFNWFWAWIWTTFSLFRGFWACTVKSWYKDHHLWEIVSGLVSKVVFNFICYYDNQHLINISETIYKSNTWPKDPLSPAPFWMDFIPSGSLKLLSRPFIGHRGVWIFPLKEKLHEYLLLILKWKLPPMRSHCSGLPGSWPNADQYRSKLWDWYRSLLVNSSQPWSGIDPNWEG